MALQGGVSTTVDLGGSSGGGSFGDLLNSILSGLSPEGGGSLPYGSSLTAVMTQQPSQHRDLLQPYQPQPINSPFPQPLPAPNPVMIASDPNMASDADPTPAQILGMGQGRYQQLQPAYAPPNPAPDMRTASPLLQAQPLQDMDPRQQLIDRMPQTVYSDDTIRMKNQIQDQINHIDYLLANSTPPRGMPLTSFAPPGSSFGKRLMTGLSSLNHDININNRMRDASALQYNANLNAQHIHWVTQMNQQRERLMTQLYQISSENNRASAKQQAERIQKMLEAGDEVNYYKALHTMIEQYGATPSPQRNSFIQGVYERSAGQIDLRRFADVVFDKEAVERKAKDLENQRKAQEVDYHSKTDAYQARKLQADTEIAEARQKILSKTTEAEVAYKQAQASLEGVRLRLAQTYGDAEAKAKIQSSLNAKEKFAMEKQKEARVANQQIIGGYQRLLQMKNQAWDEAQQKDIQAKIDGLYGETQPISPEKAMEMARAMLGEKARPDELAGKARDLWHRAKLPPTVRKAQSFLADEYFEGQHKQIQNYAQSTNQVGQIDR